MTQKGASVFNPQRFLATVGQGRTLFDLRKEEVVFEHCSRADAVFYIQKGKIKIIVPYKHGREGVVAVLGGGDFFGMGCLVGQPLRRGTARAITDSQVVKVSKLEMLRVLLDEPTFEQLFITHLLTRSSQDEKDIMDHSSTPLRTA